MDLLKPWELSNSEIKVIDGYSAKVIAEYDNTYLVEFYESNMSVVKAEMSKVEFANHPKQPEIGTYFGIVLFRELFGDGTIYVSAWPTKKYWNKRLL